MKKKLTRNGFLKILSLLFAFILWLVVVNINDPDKTITIYRIPITITNEAKITNQGIGQIYSIEYPTTGEGAVVVKGPRSVVDNLTGTSKGVTATVDFSEVSSVGAVPITYTLPDGVTLVSKRVETMRIKVEALATETFDVGVATLGVPAAGYVAGERNVSPNRVKITAPESLLEQIKQVIVEVDVDGMSSDISSQANIKLLDANGKVISYAENEHVTFSANPLQVNLTMLKTTDLEIQMTITGEEEPGYRCTGMESSADRIAVKGLGDAIGRAGTIVVLKEDNLLDISGLTEDTEVIIDLQNYLPQGLSLLDQEQRYITVILKIEPLYEKELEIDVNALEVLHMPENMTLSYDTSQKLGITIQGLMGDLEVLNVEAIHASIDLEHLAPGVHTVPVQIILAAGLELEGNPVVTVLLEKEEEETSEIIPEEPESAERMTGQEEKEPENDDETESTS